ncbi:MAG TPA: twin-arginine translocation signal domain-containing protein [Planctomycetota bacterium]|nr:twin-arginine translocation signal domain-containing protein [Planctomycetota bacterium]HRR79138.1 twin-arginine translocation signal domain-containing protein [Planctomycetota bacterium]
MRKSVTRREFLAASAAAGALLAGSWRDLVSGADGEDWPPKLPTVKIYKVFAGRTGGHYLSRPTDEIGKFNQYLDGVARKLGGVEFVGGDLIPDVKVEEVAAKLKNADGALLFHLSGHGGDAPVLSKLLDTGVPAAVFSQPFSGHGWMYFPALAKAGKKVVLLPTSDWGELDHMVALLRVPAWMRQTRVLVVGGPVGTAAACDLKQVKERLGTEALVVKNEQVLEAMNAVDLKAAEAEAEEYWLKPAQKLVEPKRDEVIQSARMYLAVRAMMARERARAITSSHCMGNPRGCLTFSKLNDEGLVGACEGDIDSTLTMLMFGYAFGVPGFITDPVFDTAKNALIHFHCTSATKLDGPSGKRQPFNIRCQTDTQGGVALEVENRVGQVVTCAKLINLDTMLISTGKIIEVTHSPLGCRTQFVTEVKDARSMFHNWGAGVLKGGVMALLHRAVFYGDHTQDIRHLGALMGFKIVEEA